MSRGLNVFVNIGGKLLPSLNSSLSAVERRFGLMNKRMRVQAAEMKATWRSAMAAAGPLLGLAAAGGLTLSAKAAIGDSAELTHELQMLRNAGRTSKEVAQAMAGANRAIRDVPTTTLVDNLKTLNETTLAYGSVGHAIENLSFNAKMGSLLRNQLGDEFGGPDTFNKFVRLIELRGGKVSSETYQRLANHFYRAMAVSGGTVNADELLGFGQQANPGMRAYSEEYLSTVVPSLIQEFGGERAGTVSSAFTRQIMGKVRMGGKGVVRNWQMLGLLKPGTGHGNNLSSTGWNPKDIVGYQLALSNPLKWFETVMIPRLKKHGYDLNDEKQVLTVASQLFGRETGARLASTYLDPKQLARIHADMTLYGKAPGVDAAYNQTLRNDPMMAWGALKASTNNMLSTMFLGKSGDNVNVVAVALLNVAKGINAIAAAFQAHPWLGKGVGTLLVGTAGIAVLKVFGVALGWLLSPLRSVFGLLFSPVGKAGARVPWIFRIGKAFARLGRFLGPLLLRGLAALAPVVMEGLAAAFALLSNPIGWGIILGAALVALVYYFRGPLMNAWKKGWNALKSWALSVNWRAVGMSIANALTFGLAGKFADALNNVKAVPGARTGMNNTRAMAGMRANGGPVLRGRTYLIGERGPELATFGASGRVIPNHHIAAMAGGPRHSRPGRSGPLVGELHVHGGNGTPAEIEGAVYRALNRLANQQAALLSD